MKFTYSIGATPIDLDEAEGLIPIHITTQEQLNEWEQANILKAENSIFPTYYKDILKIDFLKKLHIKMFDDTWRWAGTFRKTNKNIGVDKFQILIKIQDLLNDVSYQIENKSYAIDEIAYRFHHRLVAIHLFPNGNGRHGRKITDILLISLGQPRFSWGCINLVSEEETRKQYIQALRDADKHNYALLAKFVRS